MKSYLRHACFSLIYQFKPIFTKSKVMSLKSDVCTGTEELKVTSLFCSDVGSLRICISLSSTSVVTACWHRFLDSAHVRIQSPELLSKILKVIILKKREGMAAGKNYEFHSFGEGGNGVRDVGR